MLVPILVIAYLTRVSSVRFYRLPTAFKLVDPVTTNSVWTCFANAEACDPEWTHFYFDASSSHCSLRGGLVSFDFTALWTEGTIETPLPGNFYVKDVAGWLATVDGCPAETVLCDLVCALPEPLPSGPVDCNALENLVHITSANETALTNAFFRGKCSEYGRSLYSATAPYRRVIVDALWNGTLTVAERLERVAAKLDSIGVDIKEDLLAFPVGGSGTVCEFLSCAKLRFPSSGIKPKNSQHVDRTFVDRSYEHRSVTNDNHHGYYNKISCCNGGDHNWTTYEHEDNSEHEDGTKRDDDSKLDNESEQDHDTKHDDDSEYDGNTQLDYSYAPYPSLNFGSKGEISL